MADAPAKPTLEQLQKGWQPKPAHVPVTNPQGGYQPTTSEQKPNPPPKKP